MPSPKSLAPGFARITYSGTLFPHHMTIPVNYSGTPTPGSEPTLVLKDSTTASGSDALYGLISVILPFFDDATHFGLAEFHAVDADTGEDSFLWAYNIGLTGTGSGANVATGQTIVTFKTSIGSLYRLYMMEGLNAPNQHVLPPFGDAILDDLAAFVVGDTSPIYGRKNAYPFVPVSYITKSNDKLRKQQGLT